MFENYLKLLYRNLLKNRVFSIINILGLAIGIGCSILILMWVQDELSYDRFHSNYRQLYRLVLKSPLIEVAATSPPLAATIKQEVPQVEQTVRVMTASMTFAYNNISFNEKHGIFADSNFLNVFSFPLLAGDRDSLLARPNTIILTQKLVQKYYNGLNPIGTTININNREKFKVTGVLADLPTNSHLQFDYIIPMA
ncbi:MAG: ABC transporter permease, partial [Hymenobacteraceae bacterium]|nr:ABC transporter permease [Hymenobacteraceae bacterium]MDX5396076.1 ABC transporter permease [Hymenobacteraceae bacterium]MDX5443399.1 ABC transporter permease [Hymenobacteraceae bacterium]MDX5512141.1 ABC transporter permease [Hymenobacteraceae bacterium]